MKTNAIGYLRVSTEDQAREGVSLEAQRAKVEAYCELKDLLPVEVLVDEGISGKSLEQRPAIQRALEMLRSGEAKALVVFKLDRLSRSTRDVLDLADRCRDEGWSLHSISEELNTKTAAGRMVLTVLAALAEMEREQISERTTAALAHLRATGRKTGGHAPFGWDALIDAAAGSKPRLVENPSEQAAIRRMVSLRAKGVSLGMVARLLNQDGITTKRGKAWRAQQVKNALANADRFHG